MSACSLLNCHPRLKCAFGHRFVRKHRHPEKPLRGQVFGLPADNVYPPCPSRKLLSRDVSHYVDHFDLWPFTPVWQLTRPRDESCRQCCRERLARVIPMRRVVRMARRNQTLDNAVDGMLEESSCDCDGSNESGLEDYLMNMQSVSEVSRGRPVDRKDGARRSHSKSGPVVNSVQKTISPGVTQYTTKTVEEDRCSGRKMINETSYVLNENTGTMISVERTDVVKNWPIRDEDTAEN